MSKIITIDKADDEARRWLRECDLDEFCHILEEMFGGKYYLVFNSEKDDFDIEVAWDENYSGAFGELPHESTEK